MIIPWSNFGRLQSWYRHICEISIPRAGHEGPASFSFMVCKLQIANCNWQPFHFFKIILFHLSYKIYTIQKTTSSLNPTFFKLCFLLFYKKKTLKTTPHVPFISYCIDKTMFISFLFFLTVADGHQSWYHNH